MNEIFVSENIAEAFDSADYSIEMLNYPKIYNNILDSMPPRNSSFSDLSLEQIIGCEVVCASICHQINWDFLRSSIYAMTMQDNTWLDPARLSRITTLEVLQLLGNYNKPERIRAKERCSLLRSLGKSLMEIGYNYKDIFVSSDSTIKNANEIMSVLNLSRAFSKDPERKKVHILLQNLSEYKELSALLAYCKPAVDYHIIREFLRRGLVKPINQIAYEFAFNPEVQRKEQTVAALRNLCSDVFITLQWLTNFNITTLNTIEWWIGRSVCLKECPDCELKNDSSQWLKSNFDKCPFYESCYSIQVNNSFIKIVEPNYQGDSY